MESQAPKGASTRDSGRKGGGNEVLMNQMQTDHSPRTTSFNRFSDESSSVVTGVDACFMVEEEIVVVRGVEVPELVNLTPSFSTCVFSALRDFRRWITAFK